MLEDTLLRTLLLILTFNTVVLVFCMFAVLAYLKQIYTGIIIIGSTIFTDISEDVDEDISVEEK